jgi:hypothetical protein
LKCLICQGLYVGQTGRHFKARCKEHIRKIRYNKSKTEYEQHMLNTEHEYGKVEDTLRWST